jgi:hypothetical protein
MRRKSLLVGLALLVGVVGFAAGQSTSNPRIVENAAKPSGQTGRYQIVFNPNVRADTFLLDTQTGKTWVSTHFDDTEGRTVWLYRERLDDFGEEMKWIQSQPPKKP